MRIVYDKVGNQWRVFAVSPADLSFGRREFLPEAFRDGWLVFEGLTERRRLAPLPSDWVASDEDALRVLLDSALAVGQSRGVEKPLT